MKITSSIILLLLFCGKATAQSPSVESTKHKYFLDFAGGSNSFDNHLSASFGHKWYCDSHPNVYFSLGWRNSLLSGNQSDYYSAPPEYWSDKTKRDTLSVSNPLHFNSTIFASAAITFFSRLEMGFNIDLIGLTYGPKKSSNYNPNSNAVDVSSSTLGPSLLLSGSRDIGMLKSEFYSGFQVTNKWMIRGGMSSFVAEYKTEDELQQGNSRFRNMEFMPFLAVRYSW